jgi:hypothetical protein
MSVDIWARAAWLTMPLTDSSICTAASASSIPKGFSVTILCGDSLFVRMVDEQGCLIGFTDVSAVPRAGRSQNIFRRPYAAKESSSK